MQCRAVRVSLFGFRPDVCNVEATDDGEVLKCNECQGKKYGQLVTMPSDTTVSSSHDFTV